MIRGVRGATTVKKNTEEQIVSSTKRLLEKMIRENDIFPEQVSHIWFTVTDDLDAAFPAKATRLIEGWQFVPVMCAREIPVPESLPLCIRVMLTAETKVMQENVNHVYLNDAVSLRPDLELTKRKDSR
ncbi:chorismate mutase [Salibacterium halotolerans]|uniref:chorismate mutase n=1 Tax=Salibacterium halotolerans TaxID=1884432 RepID=A0A1I5Q7D8_9BACI|nr:chorismate mutase [Salibacterium halotolerans]SFP41816.1 chorismate mutase [Salibacterium halotolerans]